MFELTPPQGNSGCNKRQTGLISSKYETPGSRGRTGHAGLSPKSISSLSGLIVGVSVVLRRTVSALVTVTDVSTSCAEGPGQTLWWKLDFLIKRTLKCTLNSLHLIENCVSVDIGSFFSSREVSFPELHEDGSSICRRILPKIT